MAYIAVDSIFTIGKMVIGALLSYLCVLSLVSRTAQRLRLIGRWVFIHGWCMYNMIVGIGICNAMFIDGDGMRLRAVITAWRGAALLEFVFGTRGALVCFMSFGCNKWELNEGNSFNRFLKWSLAPAVFVVLFVLLLQVCRTFVYFCAQ